MVDDSHSQKELFLLPSLTSLGSVGYRRARSDQASAEVTDREIKGGTCVEGVASIRGVPPIPDLPIVKQTIVGSSGTPAPPPNGIFGLRGQSQSSPETGPLPPMAHQTVATPFAMAAELQDNSSDSSILLDRHSGLSLDPRQYQLELDWPDYYSRLIPKAGSDTRYSGALSESMGGQINTDDGALESWSADRQPVVFLVQVRLFQDPGGTLVPTEAMADSNQPIANEQLFGQWKNLVWVGELYLV
ncbi:unnamed protein product [Protopolystoma xenopodis]|uniref:Uncharacterized protein n=1 Tax=Protopolystoma xenopodis TaxID=117903 RepID=A0A3S5AD51_9PLAT|nr:unnamed protein product [Protopolystoma xenopodis]